MQLQSQIIVKPSALISKKIQSGFDHKYKLMDPQNSLSSSKIPILKYSLMQSIVSNRQQTCSCVECIIACNLVFDMSTLQQILSDFTSYWECIIVEYEIKSGKRIFTERFNHQNILTSSIQPVHDIKSMSIYSIRINLSNGNIKNIYFLPPGFKQDLLPTSSTHQMLKIISSLRVYMSIQQYPSGQIMFQDDFSEDMNSFIYEQSANKITIIANIRQGESIDERLIEQIGQLKIPEPWRQKYQYRSIKKSIHTIKLQQYRLLQSIKGMKKSVTKTINQLQKLVGFPELTYSQISIDKIHKLKSQCFSDKVAKINQHDHNIQALTIRLKELQTRKEQLQLHKNKTQHQQISQLLLLKTSVANLQTSQFAFQQTKVRPQTAEGCIYKRDKPKLHKQLMTTIFSRVQKTKNISNFTSVSIPKDDEKTSERIKLQEKQTHAYKSFRKVEKKVAAVVKSGLSGNIQLNIPKLKEELDMAKLQVDFSVEKKIQHKKQQFQNASRFLQNLIQGDDQIRFFSMAE